MLWRLWMAAAFPTRRWSGVPPVRRAPTQTITSSAQHAPGSIRCGLSAARRCARTLVAGCALLPAYLPAAHQSCVDRHAVKVFSALCRNRPRRSVCATESCTAARGAMQRVRQHGSALIHGLQRPQSLLSPALVALIGQVLCSVNLRAQDLRAQGTCTRAQYMRTWGRPVTCGRQHRQHLLKHSGAETLTCLRGEIVRARCRA